MKETAKVKKESKETCHRERLEKTNGLLITAPHFQNKMEGDFLQLKKIVYQRQICDSQGYKNRRFPGKKIQQKGSFLLQEHASVKKK